MKLKCHSPSLIHASLPNKKLQRDFLMQTDRIASSIHPLSPEIQPRRSDVSLRAKNEKNFKNFSQERMSDVTTTLPSNDRIQQEKNSPIVFNSSLKAPNLSNFKGRDQMQIELLDHWLKTMISVHIPDIEVIMKKNLVPRSEVTKKVEDIYIVVLNEIIKQVASQSLLRAELLEKSVKTLKYYWNSYTQHLNFLRNTEKDHYEKTCEDLEAKYKQKVDKHKNRLKLSLIRIRRLEEDNNNIAKELGLLKKSPNYRDRVDILRNEKNTHISEGTQVDLETKVWSEVSQDSLSKNIQISVGTQVNLETKVWSEVSQNSLSKSISFRPSSSIKNKDNQKVVAAPVESEIGRNDKKKNAIIEIRNVTGYKEPENLKELEELIEDVYEKVSCLNDWIFGFKVGYQFMSPNKKTTFLCVPGSPFTDKLNNSVSSSKSKISKTDNSETISASQIISKMLEYKEENLQEYSKNTQKKILKHINKSLLNSLGKTFTKDSTLADQVLQELINRYNIRKIAEQKLKEFIVGCILNSTDNLRIKLFSCALGCGSYTKNVNFPLQCVNIYMKLFETMFNSKSGIILEAADPLNIEFYPLCRAFDVVRIVFGKVFQYETLNSLMIELKKVSVPDANCINKDGSINLDLFVDTCMEAYLEFYEAVRNGVKISIKAITELNYLSMGEYFMIVRQIAKEKFEQCKVVKMDKNREIEIEDCFAACLENGALVESEVLKFFANCEKDYKKIEREIEAAEHKMNEVDFSKGEMTEEEWREKFDELHFIMKGKRNDRCFHMWHLMKCDFELLLKHN